MLCNCPKFIDSHSRASVHKCHQWAVHKLKSISVFYVCHVSFLFFLVKPMLIPSQKTKRCEFWSPAFFCFVSHISLFIVTVIISLLKPFHQFVCFFWAIGGWGCSRLSFKILITLKGIVKNLSYFFMFST